VAWERQGNHVYFYRSRRAGRRVVRDFYGNGPEAQLAAALVEQRRQRQQAAREGRRAAQEPWDEAARPVDELRTALELLVDVALLAGGFHQHRGQWRISRDAEGL
jgi:hypothetical protein